MADQDGLFGRKIRDFIVGKLIGEGGFGRVYRGEQPTLGREVVIKVLHERQRARDDLLQRFLREAQLASRLAHPYAAHIYGFDGEDDGLVWIAMEYVHGITLKHWLRDRGPMSLEQLVPFFERVAEVVQEAHDHGIVHRDLKPSNVMVLERAGQLFPKLLDFGVAKLLDSEQLPESTPDIIRRLRALGVPKVPDEVLQQFREGRPSTVTGSSPLPGGGPLTPDHAMIGTPGYMAPEQWSRAFSVGPWSDLYALGVIAFEALTGHRPFEGPSMSGGLALREQPSREPPRRDQVPPLGGDFPPALDQVFQRALAERPDRRFGSAPALAGALRAASGLAAGRADLPQADLPKLDADVRDAWLAGAPQPLAESVAVLDGARNAHQAHIATQELARNLLRYLLAVTLAARVQTRESQDDPALLDLLQLVRALDRRELNAEERVQLLRLLVRPLTGRPGTHPIPELVDLVTPGPGGSDGLEPMLALLGAFDHAGAADVVRARLGQLIPELTQLLRTTAFVLDYGLVIPRGHAADRWTGRRRQPRVQVTVPGSEIVEGHPLLLDRNGRVCVDLWPLVQAVPLTDGGEPELFLFDGPGHHGVRLLAAPAALEHHDAIARDWLATHVVAEIEAQARMRDRIRVAAHQWHNRDRPNVLLWRGEVLAELERWTHHTASAASLGDPEAAFVAASHRASRRARWIRRALVVLAMGAVLAGIQYRAAQQTREAQQRAEMAQQRAEMTQQLSDLSTRQAEVEAGRQALLHDDIAEAQLHLSEAYRRGDHSPGTAFMLARALQPLRAKRARFAAAVGHMWSAAFSPDGRQIVTTDDACARIWDARTHQLMFTLPHGDSVYDARYSADGARLVTASGDGAVRIWDTATGGVVHTLKRQRPEGKPPRYFVAAISPDGRLVAAIDTTGAVAHVWDAVSGAPLAELLNHAADFPSIAFSADARWLATSGGDDARVFDARTWTQVLTLAVPRIRALSFDPTASRLLTGSADGDAAIWDILSRTRARHLREIGEPIRAVAFSPDGQLVATGGGDGAAQIWDARSGALRNQINTARTKLRSIEFDPTSALVVATGEGGAVIVAEALGMPVAMLEVPRGLVTTAHFAPTSHHVIGASWDGTARVWDAASPYRRWSSPPVATDCGLATSLDPDKRFIAIGCRDRNTRVWDTASNQLLAELPSVTPVAGDFASAFPAVSDAGDRAAIARGDTVEVYDLPSRRLLRVIRHGTAVNAVAFAPAGHDLMSGATDGSLLVTRDGGEPIVLPASGGGIDTVGFLVDGRAVAADAHGRLRIYDPDRAAVIADLALPFRVRLLRPSPDGRQLITIPNFTGKAAPPLLWDLEHYRLIAPLEDHVGRTFSARYVDQGHAVVTVGVDGAVRLWNSETGRLLSTYYSTSRYLADAVVVSDGSKIIAGGSDGLLWFWDRTTARPLWTLQAHSSHIVGIHLQDDEVVTRGFAGDVARWSIPEPSQVIGTMPPDH